MKPVRFYTITGLLAAFGLLTTFLAGSIILDLFNIREHEGNYVLFIVWANLFSGILFLVSALGFFMRKKWADTPLIISLAVLVLAFAGLLFHINGGGAYETKTVGAMIFRITVNVVMAFLVHSAARKYWIPVVPKTALFLLIPMALFVAGCGHQHGENSHDHQAMEPEASHHHHDADVGQVELNDGKKWEADEHTLSVVASMNSAVSAYDKTGSHDYKTLADSLTNQLNVLVAGCTMKGPPHDALHQWLVPYTEQVKDLSSATDADKASETVLEIKESLDVFGRSFE